MTLKHIVEIDGHKCELTTDQLKKLRDELDEVLGPLQVATPALPSYETDDDGVLYVKVIESH